MKNLFIRVGSRSRGSALLIVLAFLLLLTTLTVAFLSRATFERQLSNASFSQGKVDLAGQGAVAAIIGDFQNEIVAGSNVGNSGSPSAIPDLTQGGTVSGYYYPNVAATAVPAVVGYAPAVGDGLEDLLKVSKNGLTFFPSGGNYANGTPSNRASAINSVSNASLNNRSVTTARWNKPLLLAKNTPTSTSDLTPVTKFPNPDWIYIGRDGSNPGSSSGPAWSSALMINGNNPVTQRYAYAVYDEGSTLDLNVAGSPVTGASGTTVTYSANQAYKNALPYADLTQLPGINALTGANQQAFINGIVGWRNFASSNLLSSSSNAFPTYSTITAANATYFDQNVIFNTTGFLSVLGFNSGGNPTFGGNPSTTVSGVTYGSYHPGGQNQTDNAFIGRQQLLQFVLLNLGQNQTFLTNSALSLSSLQNLLPYLGTFTRDINQPSYAPDPNRPVVQTLVNGGNDMAGQAYSSSGQNQINPAFLNVTATSSFIRNDGTTAIVGEPLVKKRFALNRLAWLTYKGPSALRTAITGGTAPSSSTTSADYDLYALENTYGIPQSFLMQGTATTGATAASQQNNIMAYFGLAWVQDTSTSIGIGDGTFKWKYEHGTNNSGASPTTSGAPGRIMTLGQVQATGREPDFFELLKASVTVGAIAKPGSFGGSDGTVASSTAASVPAASQVVGAGATPAAYSFQKDASVDAYIMQLGANIIAQSNPSNYCPRIIFDDNVTFNNGTDYPQEYRGVEDLPYMYRTRSMAIKYTDSNPAERADNFAAQPYPNVSPAPSSPAVNPLPAAQMIWPGSGYYVEIPEIWNPHSWNPGATTAAGISPVNGAAGQFQIVMLSSDPNNNSLGATTLAFCSKNNATAPPAGGYLSATAAPSFTFTPASYPYIRFTIPPTRLDFFREPTLLDKPDPSTVSSTYPAPGAASLPTNAAGPPAGSLVTSSMNGTSLTASPTGSPTTTYPTTGYIQSYYVSNAYTAGTDNQAYLGFNLADPAHPTYPLWITNVTGAPAGYYQVSELMISTSNPNIRTSATPATKGVGGNAYFTYRMQYLDPITSGKWDTYDEKFMPLAYPINGADLLSNVFEGGKPAGGDPGVPPGYDLTGCDDYVVVADPRTNRWVDQADIFTPFKSSFDFIPPPETDSGTASVAWAGWIDQSINAVMSARPDYNLGWPVKGNTPTNLGFYNPITSLVSLGLAPMTLGLVSQNTVASYAGGNGLIYKKNPVGANFPATAQYYADPDGVVRRGVAAYSTVLASSSAPAETTPWGLPLAISTTLTGTATGVPASTSNPMSATQASGAYSGYYDNGGNRPIILHRPFRTVGELGYTFSGTPGKNIDFSTTESGYSALLDVFSINDTNDPGGLVAGKVNINSRQAPVLQAILGAAYKDEYAGYYNGVGNSFTKMLSTEASALITDSTYGLVQRTAGANTTTGQGPLRNLSELVGKFVPSNYTSSNRVQTTPPAYQPSNTTASSSLYSGFSSDMNSIAATGSSAPPMNVVPRYHEAAVRALAANTTSRVWNLMLDVIAQTGRFPVSAAGLGDFNVEGERRYWVHVAIDRYTGKVLDEQIEEIKE